MAEPAAVSQLAERFEQLVALAPTERETMLRGLAPALARSLRALLAADGWPDACISDALAQAADSALAPTPPGAMIGSWRILRELGSGGMGTVLLAERTEADFTQMAAIKLIRGFPSTDGIRRLRQERQILAGLDHPNIARLIDGGETADGQPYLVVEYVPGLTLDAFLAARQPGRDDCIGMVERIAAAVQHAHQHLVIHRDLKPANVMIRDDGEIKLLDFGVAKLIDLGNTDASAGSTRVFTPGYASPEQTAGRAVGMATDIYSLGVLLREILSGPGATALPAPDAELQGIVNKATAEDPGQRYTTMAALADDLSRYRRGLPISAAADTRAYRLRKLVQRHRLATAFGLLAVAIIAGLMVYLALALQQTERERQSAQTARVEAEANLRRAQAVTDFFAEMFEGVAPEQALGRALLPADLLARAERQLREHPPTDAPLRADLAAALGSLYQRLGDGNRAAALLQQSLSGPAPDGRESAFTTAKRQAQLALVLGELDRNDEALKHLQAAVALRRPYAVAAPELDLQSALELGAQYARMHQHDAAAGELARAQQLLLAGVGTIRQQIDLHQVESAWANDEERYSDCAQAAQAGLALLAAHPELPQTLSIELLHMQARAAQGQGQIEAAEAAFARAIDAQRRWIGDSGTRAMGLHNDHAIMLASLGRFAEAELAYQRAAQIFAEVGGPALESNPRHLNNLCDAESGRGDYPAALRHCQAALEILLRERAAADPERLIVESNLARILALIGQADTALIRFENIRLRAIAVSGKDSFPVGLHAFRAARAAMLAGKLDAADRFSAEATRIFNQSFPAPHPWRARGLRVAALVALAHGDNVAAASALKAALDEATATLPMRHPLRAWIALDQAELALRNGDRVAAQGLLDPALAVLRACCTSSEIDRAAAEALALRLRSGAK